LCSAGGLAAATCGWNQLQELTTWNPFAERTGLLALGVLLAVTGLAISAGCATSLCFLSAPSRSASRWTIFATGVALVLIPLCSLLAFEPMRAEAIGSHSAGAGFGVLIVVIIIPLFVWLLLCAHLGLHLTCKKAK
jgi:hypothetical protein